MNESMLSNALASAGAGIIGRIFCHPLDTAKARLQATSSSGTMTMSSSLTSSASTLSSSTTTMAYRNTLDVLRRTAYNEGIRGLYRGFETVIIGGTPGTVLYLCTYEICKQNLGALWTTSSSLDQSKTTSSPNGEFLIHFSSGMIAETVACVVYVPVDVIKDRMQIQHSSSPSSSSTLTGGRISHPEFYRNSWDAMKKISASEGLSGIYRGYTATLASFGPFSALYFVFYEKSKHLVRQHLTGTLGSPSSARSLEHIEIPFPWVILCSSTAGALASWITSPLDMAKLRLQIQRGIRSSQQQHTSSSGQSTNYISDSLHYKGMMDCLIQTYHKEGVRGLFRGALARVIFTVPLTTITMTSFETCRVVINRILNNG